MSRYRYVILHDHPLTTAAHGMVPEHRVVLYDKIGPGPHPCHWCGVSVDWQPGRRTAKGALVTDHLDSDPTNNASANLVPSCSPCNTARGSRKVRDDEVYVVDRGKRVRAAWRACEFCDGGFLVRLRPADPTRGRFCSRSCRAKAQQAQQPGRFR